MFTASTARLTCLAIVATAVLGGCVNEAAEQRRAEAKTVQTAQHDMDMLPFDVQEAAKAAGRVVNDLRAVSATTGPLAGLKSAITARAELVMADAAIDASRADRRTAAQLAGRIEARLLALADLEQFIAHAPFRAEQLGVSTLQRDASSRADLVGALQMQAAQFEQTIEGLRQTQAQAQAQVAAARANAMNMRDEALGVGGADAIDGLAQSGAMLAAIAPDESRLDELQQQIALTLAALEQLRLLIDGEAATIAAIEAEQAAIDGFIRERAAQVDAVQQHVAHLRDDLAEDATALAALEADVLPGASATALQHFTKAASEAGKAARADRGNGGADIVLEVAARQGALSVAANRLQNVTRSLSVFNLLASIPGMPDAAAWREQARAMGLVRDEALAAAVDAADSAMAAAERMSDNGPAEAIRQRIKTLQSAFAGSAVSSAP